MFLIKIHILKSRFCPLISGLDCLETGFPLVSRQTQGLLLIPSGVGQISAGKNVLSDNGKIGNRTFSGRFLAFLLYPVILNVELSQQGQ